MLSLIVLSFPLTAVVALVAGIRLLARSRFEQRALRSPGVVTAVGPTAAQRPLARFPTAAGAEIETPVRSGPAFEALRCGDPVVVLYDPDDPTRAALLQDRRLRKMLAVVLLVTAVLMLFVGICVFYALAFMEQANDGFEAVLTQPAFR